MSTHLQYSTIARRILRESLVRHAANASAAAALDALQVNSERFESNLVGAGTFR